MKITAWVYALLTAVVVMAGIAVTGATERSIRQQNYIFQNGVTRDVTARTFVIDEDSKTKPLTIRTSEKAVTGRQSAETGNSGNSRQLYQQEEE